MNVGFSHVGAEANDPVIFEQVFAEKPGGGRIANPSFDVPAGTAVAESGKLFVPIKGFRLYAANAAADTNIKVFKGSGVAANDYIGYGSVAVKATAVDTTNDNYDLVTVTMGVDIAAEKVLYQAKAASANAAEPIYTPKYVTGRKVFAGKGDQGVKLVNGANMRKETANFGDDIAKLLTLIELV